MNILTAKSVREIGLPIVAWLYFVFNGIAFGFEIGRQQIGPSDAMPVAFQGIAYSAGFIMGFLVTFVNLKRGKMAFENFLERLFTPESFEIMERRTKPFILAATCLGSSGIIGLVFSKLNKMPTINSQISIFPLSIGVGILSAWFVCKGKSWRDRESAKAVV